MRRNGFVTAALIGITLVALLIVGGFVFSLVDAAEQEAAAFEKKYYAECALDGGFPVPIRGTPACLRFVPVPEEPEQARPAKPVTQV